MTDTDQFLPVSTQTPTAKIYEYHPPPLATPPHKSQEKYVKLVGGSFFSNLHAAYQWKRGGNVESWIQERPIATQDPAPCQVEICRALIRGDGKILSSVKCTPVENCTPLEVAGCYSPYRAKVTRYSDVHFLEGISTAGHMF